MSCSAYNATIVSVDMMREVGRYIASVIAIETWYLFSSCFGPISLCSPSVANLAMLVEACAAMAI